MYEMLEVLQNEERDATIPKQLVRVLLCSRADAALAQKHGRGVPCHDGW
jgi:hypothetical protein